MLITRISCTALLVVVVGAPAFAQDSDAVPELSGVWDGGPRARPVMAQHPMDIRKFFPS
ncbi:MAG: hypothetical protein Ct9H300mP25_05710 [Acidobacteriota bacterium]|nr:MAG: hypothetical protein Ct9H300mP25_05710 [Acidobacteriota bacterium]